MSFMRFFDADTHVHECIDTWSYFPESMKEYRPLPMVFENDEQPPYLRQAPGARARGWFIEGQLYNRQQPSDERTGTTEATRELHDVPARLKAMDELEVEAQVIYPTILLNEVTIRPELEVAICESYNRWIADRCAESGGRLHWAAVLPLRSMPHALLEMRRAKESGAVAFFKRAYECDDRHASDPYFDPVYALAQDLETPVSIHASGVYTGTTGSFSKLRTRLPNATYVIDAFFSIVKDGVCDKFPTLRFGFIEAGGGWVPHQAWMAGFSPSSPTNRRYPGVVESRLQFEKFLEDSRIFITCEASENIPLLVQQMGDRTFMTGSDYSHADRASVKGMHQIVALREGLSEDTVQRITHDNAKRYYGLT